MIAEAYAIGNAVLVGEILRSLAEEEEDAKMSARLLKAWGQAQGIVPTPWSCSVQEWGVASR